MNFRRQSTDPSVTAVAVQEGVLIKRGHLLKAWRPRYFRLLSSKLVYYKGEKPRGKPRGVFDISPRTRCTPSSEKPFCFKLSAEGAENSGKAILLQARNNVEKDIWMSAFTAVISARRRAMSMNLDANGEVDASYIRERNEMFHERPQVSVRVGTARRLQGEEGRKGIFAQIRLGQALAQTPVVRGVANPTFSETFTFDFNRSMRFLSVTLWEHNDMTAHDLIGEALVPLSGVGTDCSGVAWHSLTRRTRERDGGEVQLEIRCNVPRDAILWHVFRRVQALPCFRIFPPAPTSSHAIAPPPLRPFPHEFPPVETEVIEDVSFRVTLRTGVDGQLCYANGVLFLTNYRLVFVPDCRFEEPPPHPAADLALSIPLRSITAASQVKETSIFGLNLAPPFPALRIRTRDVRLATFIFRPHATPTPTSPPTSPRDPKGSSYSEIVAAVKANGDPAALYQKIVAWLTHPHPAANAHPYYRIQKTWSELDATAMTAPAAEEGPASERIWKRLELILMNPAGMDIWAETIHEGLVQTISKGRAPEMHSLRMAGPASGLNQSSWVEALERRKDSGADEVHRPALIEELSASTLGHARAISEEGSVPDDIEEGHPSGLGAEMAQELRDQRQRIHAARQLRHAWNLLDLEAEYIRFGADKPGSGLRIMRLNSDFNLCETYPQLLCTATGIADSDITLAAQFRSRERIPVVSYVHPATGAVMLRSSQPKVGMGGARNIYDEALLDGLRTTRDPQASMMIFDARPKLNASVNKTAGKGFEDLRRYFNCTIDFMGIPNIHVMRRSVDMLDDAITGDAGVGPVPSIPTKVDAPLGSMWPLAGYGAEMAMPLSCSAISALDEQSGWRDHVLRLLTAASLAADAMSCRGASVLVHCSDGWDRTSQVGALVELALDPQARTIEGFCRLVDKQWIAFGHRFHMRSGFAAGLGTTSQERSPIFRQFLEAVSYLVKAHPGFFEFDDRLLVYLLKYGVYSNWFGTFLSDSHLARQTRDLQSKTVSAWHPILVNREGLRNPGYLAQGGVLSLNPNPRLLGLWDAFVYENFDQVLGAAAQQRRQLMRLSMACEDAGARSETAEVGYDVLAPVQSVHVNGENPMHAEALEKQLMGLLHKHSLSDVESAHVSKLLRDLMASKGTAMHAEDGNLVEELLEDEGGKQALARLSSVPDV